VDHIAIRFHVWTEDEHLETVGASFEGSRDAWAHPDRVERHELHEFVIELDGP